MPREYKTTTMQDNPSGDTPRYTYAKPTEKSQSGKPRELGTEIESYRLPVIDVDTQKRNFPGYAESHFYSLDEIRQGDDSGTTESDVNAPEMYGESEEGYSTINKKDTRRVNIKGI